MAQEGACRNSKLRNHIAIIVIMVIIITMVIIVIIVIVPNSRTHIAGPVGIAIAGCGHALHLRSPASSSRKSWCSIYSEKKNEWEFPKIRGLPYFGVLIIRILLFRVLY